MTHYGVDIYSGDNPCNLQAAYVDLKARSSGQEPFLFIKATEGITYTNPYFAINLKDGRAAGFKAIGAYHFFHPIDNVQQQVNFFRSVAGNLPAQLDDESTDNLSWAAVSTAVSAWYAVPSEANDIHYLNGNFLNNVGSHGKPLWWPVVSGRTPPNTWIEQSTTSVAGFPRPDIDFNKWVGTDVQFDSFFNLGVIHVPSKAIPVTVVSASISIQGVAPDRVDALMVGSDGKVYHKWFMPSVGWQGYDVVSDAT